MKKIKELTICKKTGKYYFKPKFFGGWDLYFEEKLTVCKDKLPTEVYYEYRKGNKISDMGELGLLHDNMKSKFK